MSKYYALLEKFTFTGNQALAIHTAFIIIGALAQGLGVFTVPDWYINIYYAVLAAVSGHKLVAKLKGKGESNGK